MRSQIVGIMASGFLASAALADGPNTMIVFDASGSMWGQIDGVTKIEIAREAFANTQDIWDSTDQNVGLIAYGHRRKGDCGDIEALVPLVNGGGGEIAEQVQTLRPKGKTPLSDAIHLAASELRFREETATVVLFSDGIETCNADPCALAAELEQDGINFTAHVIGFGLSSDTDRAQLQCIADNTGGTFLEASDVAGLQDALTQFAATPEPVEAAPQPIEMVPVRIRVQEAEGTARPDQITFRATNAASGDRLVLGSMRGAAEVISGLQAELPLGEWLIEAISEEGGGEVTITVSIDTQQIDVPFKANDTSFVLLADGPYRLGTEHAVFLGVTDPLQANADYTVALYPAGATEFNQRIDWETRFGSDSTGFTEHGLAPPDAPGEYEIIVLQGYDLSAAKARFPITYQTDAPIRWLGKTHGEPGETLPIRISGDMYRNNNLALRTSDGTDVVSQWVQAYVTDGTGPALPLPENPGVYELFYRATTEEGEISLGSITVGDVVLEDDPDAVAPPSEFDDANAGDTETTGVLEATLRMPDGHLADIPASWMFLRAGEAEPVTRKSASGLGRFEDLRPGQYTVSVTIEEDIGTLLEGKVEIEILSGETTQIDMPLTRLGNDIGDHGGTTNEGEDPASMLSEEELAAESGPRADISFEVDQRCDGPDPCNIKDPRVALDVMLPVGWGMSEAFYYTTAGGSQAEHPTVFMANLVGSSFDVALNPRQWDAMLGPCETVPMGELCRTESEIGSDLAAYELIKNSFLGIKPQPSGYLEIGRSWTLENRLLGGVAALIKIDSPQIGAETVSGQVMLSNPASYGLTITEPFAVTVYLYWTSDDQVESLYAQPTDASIPLDIRLKRPDDWDGVGNIWRGEVTNRETFKGVLVNAY